MTTDLHPPIEAPDGIYRERPIDPKRTALRCILTLSEVVGSRRCGRSSNSAAIICDFAGTGAQDTAIAAEALRRVGRCALER
jgi:ornithine cyclodeaminase/alanine dehydrogenase-like protein (mu-crystallin family)